MVVKNFKTVIGEAEFSFNTLNTVKAQAFQVYVNHEGKKRRFHMQLNAADNFFITDPTSCPEIYLPLETALGQAIRENNSAAVVFA